ncbi:MAG: hypothetical protein AAFX76_11740 [Planctomycetota bacterium]
MSRVDAVFGRVAGVLGGGVFGLVICVIGLRVCQTAGIGWGYWLAVSGLVFLITLPAGLIGYRYFGNFLIPVFNLFSGGLEDWSHSNRSLLLCLSLVVAIIALLVSVLIQSHVAFGLGLLLFTAFAIASPRVYVDEGLE